jgi:hypothetical protein
LMNAHFRDVTYAMTMVTVPAFAEPLLAHARLYEELATACADEKLALELRNCAQQCLELAIAVAPFGVTAGRLGNPTATAPDSRQTIH